MKTTSLNAYNVIARLKERSSPARADASLWFFKTAKGQYGYGDKFIGVNVPNQRKIAKMFAGLPLNEIGKLLESPIHECRLTALFILVGQFKKANEGRVVHSTTHAKASRKLTNLHGRQSGTGAAGKLNAQIGSNERMDENNATLAAKIVKFYLMHTDRINNWDLVDSSASYILGTYLINRDRKILYKLAVSKNIWERRIAIIATLALIKSKKYEDTLKISEMLLNDPHDLIHKAVGWMLREVGKMSRETLIRFLKENAGKMPRTALRYAIEHFSKPERDRFMVPREEGST